MRPLRLEMEGFGAFRDSTVVDWNGVDFFALVGPTGSGKSTVIDGICFALYGSVPRYEKQNLVDPIISLGGSEAKVRLDFEVAGEQYTATRVVRRGKRGSSTKEARLERVRPEGPVEVLAGSAPELDKAIVEVLGLRFDDFTRCVVLPQGEFSRFLRDRPSERNDLLVRLLDLGLYRRIAERARQRDLAARAEEQVHRDRLDRLAFATPDARTEAAARVEGLVEFRRHLDAVGDEVGRSAERAAAAEAVAAEAARLGAALGLVRMPDAARAVGELSAEASAAVERLELATRDALARVDRAESELRALPDAGALRQAAGRLTERDALRGEVEALDRAALEAAESLEAARRAEAQTLDEQRAARARLESLSRSHMAHELAHGLELGQPCPVCHHVVDELPASEQPAELDEARAACERADEAVGTARSLMDRRGAAHAKAVVARDHAASRLAELDAAVAGLDAAEVDAALTAVEEHSGALDQARQAERTVRDELDGARTALQKAEARTAKAWEVLHAQRDPVASLSPPAVVGRALVTEWTALAEWAATAAIEQRQRHDDAAAELAAARSVAQGLVAAAEAAAAELGITAETDRAAARTAGEPARLARLRERAASAETSAREQLRRIDEALTEAATLAAKVAGLAERAAVARELGKLLDAKHFEPWVVAEALDELAETASSLLQQLSSGQYSLQIDDKAEFCVVDHRNADEIRSVRTLSGGETFQASLALALALAERIAGFGSAAGSKLEAIFLDEGFGTLDPEALEVVAATIETLGDDGRMVGIVTHVTELAQRVPVRYVVRKGVHTSTVTPEP